MGFSKAQLEIAEAVKAGEDIDALVLDLAREQNPGERRRQALDWHTRIQSDLSHCYYHPEKPGHSRTVRSMDLLGRLAFEDEQ